MALKLPKFSGSPCDGFAACAEIETDDKMILKGNAINSYIIYAIRRDLGHSNKGLTQGKVLSLFVNDIADHLKPGG